MIAVVANIPPVLEFDPVEHVYTLNGDRIPSVTQVLKDVGIIDATWFNEMAKSRGNAVHAACQFLDEGCLDWSTLHPDLVNYVRAYEKFKAESSFVPEAIEKALAHPNASYAGTPDRVGVLNGLEVVIDLKTGGPCDWHAIQLAAYHNLLSTNHSAVLKSYALYLREDGSYRLLDLTDTSWHLSVFLSALQVYHWKQKHGRTGQ